MNKLPRTSLALAGVAVLAGCLLPSTPAHDFSATDVARNRAIAASPRAIEAFPWLARGMTSAGELTPVAARSSRVEPVRNRALASSPRAIEEFPGLGRPVERVRVTSTPSLLSGLPGSRGTAANPRAIEEFPALRRFPGGLGGAGTDAGAFQIAPLK